MKNPTKATRKRKKAKIKVAAKPVKTTAELEGLQEVLRDKVLGPTPIKKPIPDLVKPPARQPVIKPAKLPKGGTTKTRLIPGAELQHNLPGDLPLQKNSNDPLLLLPLRLEYRIVQSAERLRILGTFDKVMALAEAKALVKGKSKSARVKREKKAAEVRSLQGISLNDVRLVKPAKKDLIWFRWFPDSNFSESGIAAPDADETSALEVFLTSDTRGSWPDLSNEGVNQAWQTFGANVGLARAIHLMRTRGNIADKDWGKRVGRIAALPKYVKLFALNGEQLTEIGRGLDIPANTATETSAVSYAPTQLDDLEWLTDFNSAVDHGMGVRISDQDKVKIALKAEWIIAVGIYPGRAEDEIAKLLQDRVANGALEFLAQDAPTNNSPSGTVNYRAQSADMVADTGAATQFEVSAGQQQNGAADLLAKALGLEPKVLKQGINSNDSAFADAQAMLRVVGPALLDEALDGKTHLTDVTETEFLDVMATAVVARGVLSPMRIGDNAYGVATMTDLREMKRNRESSNPRDRVEAFMMDHASGLRIFYPSVASSRVPVIEPDDPVASTKLEEILKINRVSTRLDVSEAGRSSSRAIGCPYVDGQQDQYKPGFYLKALRSKPITRLPDPTEEDRRWPMLYRLARQTLTRNTVFQLIKPEITRRTDLKSSALQNADRQLKAKIRPGLKSMNLFSAQGLSTVKTDAIAGITPQTLKTLRVVNRAFSDALYRLNTVAARPDGIAQLEVLMLEVFDLFQYRIDAWATGLAYSRLQDNRRENRTQSLFGGYYGMLGKLRRRSATSQTDGYIQAPTSAHATSAAVMRSAYLRQRSGGAFAINLRSGRATRAMKILEMLRKGMTLAEALGLRGERWLRDNESADEISSLRKKYPLSTTSGRTRPTAQRLFNGLALVEGGTGTLNNKQTALRAALVDYLDAVSDLVIAEAVHLRTMGATDAAAAWLDILSGGPVPGAPAVLKTQRYGHGSDHRVSLVLPDGASLRNDQAPRTLGDPNFAAMAADIMADFTEAFVEVRAVLVETPNQVVVHQYSLAGDLGMTPVDFVIGGVSEAKTRAGFLAKRSWIEGRAPFAQLGQLPSVGTASALQASVIWDMKTNLLDDGLQLQAQAERLRRIGQRARPLDAGDLNAAADPDATLDESILVDLMRGAVQDLAIRANELSLALNQRLQSLTQARSAFFNDAFALLSEQSTSTPERLPQLGVALQVRWSALQDALWDVAGFGAPEALRLQSIGDMLDGLRDTEERAVQLEMRLGAKSKPLAAAAAAVQDMETKNTAASIRVLIAQLSGVIKSVLDGDAFPVAPVYERRDETALLVGGPQDIDAILADWAPIRKSVRGSVELLGSMPTWKAHPVLEQAVAPDGIEDQFKPSESEEPQVRHFGIFLSATAPAARLNISGFVVDDWIEQRPSMTQDAAIAVNYDTPQSEAPNCLLLCVPPKTGAYTWTNEQAAKMVTETIAWMKTRALATHDHLVSPTLRPGMNQVAYAGSGSKQTRRIPKASVQFKVGTLVAADAQLEVVKTTSNFKPIKLSSVERSGFTRIKE